MLKALVLCVCLVSCATMNAQAPASPQPAPTYPNYSIMLVNPAGGAVVLMHNPKNEIEYVDASKTGDAFKAGYVPVRVAEIAEIIASLHTENDHLAAENIRLRNLREEQTSVTSPPPSRADVEAQQRAQAASDNAVRRQQLLQAFIMMQANRPQLQPYQLPMPVNPNAGRLRTDCTTQRTGNTSYTNCN